MWNVNPDKDRSRGGFQDRDVGRTSFDENYGPEYGVDYARFSDTPDLGEDLRLKDQIEEQFALQDQFRDGSVFVRNGFVFLKGSVPNAEVRRQVADFVRSFPDVVEVINQISIEDISYEKH